MKTPKRLTFTWMLTALILLTTLALPVVLSMMHPAAAQAATRTPTSKTRSNQNPVCTRQGKGILGSAGMQMWCFGPSPNGRGSPSTTTPITTRFSTNVDAANPHEDITPAGVQAYGQSETSIAAVGPYVVEAWNDATGLFAPCPSPMFKEEVTGYGFSANGGRSFRDEGGLPNTNCTANVLSGDPSVEAWRSGGAAYFYISSLYDSPSRTGLSFLALNACKATGTGSAATISCSQPIIIATSTQCVTINGTTFCSFLDKEYLALDPVRGRLYVSYTEFGVQPTGDLAAGQIELAVCDIGTPSGGTGSAGGTAGSPVCEPGTMTTPYLAIAPGPTCENEGAYPAVDLARGDVYVAYEFNWVTNLGPVIGAPAACRLLPTQNVVTFVPFSCLALAASSPCSGPAKTNAAAIISMDAAFIPGYNRFPANDFPRIAVSDRYGTVSIVWNDARLHPLGDIFMQSFALGSLSPVQGTPLRLNSHASGGLHFMPALRNADADGHLNVSWYERSSPTTTLTNVFAALSLNPRTTSRPSSSTLVTDVPSNWLVVSSDIVPNFGDYTDNYVIATTSAPFTGQTLYVAWSDGRLGLPQPFEAHAQTN